MCSQMRPLWSMRPAATAVQHGAGSMHLSAPVQTATLPSCAQLPCTLRRHRWLCVFMSVSMRSLSSKHGPQQGLLGADVSSWQATQSCASALPAALQAPPHTAGGACQSRGRAPGQLCAACQGEASAISSHWSARCSASRAGHMPAVLSRKASQSS